MIYLILMVVGLIFLIAGFYTMSFGFSTPPNFLLFFAGLCSFLIGFMMLILFGSKIDAAALRPSRSKPKKAPTRDKTKIKKPPTIKKTVESKKPKPKPIQPVKKAPEKVETKKEKAEIKPEKKRKPRKFLRMPRRTKKEDTSSEKPVEKAEKPKAKTSPEEAKDVKIPPEASVKKKEPSKKVTRTAKAPVKLDKKDNHYVKARLNRLKTDYIENVDDVEGLIEERLDSFRGALKQIRSESMAPSIIWSFDAADVQDAMKETIITAQEKIIMMYPWIRNIDVGILKKFMDTESRVIIQEASLDDDTSVELIKVLVDNQVQIKTMPHVHTVAVVSDDKNGLIISTDPIYESFEVGVIYKDEKSISEIEKLFEEAWKLSRDIDLEVT